MSVSGNAPDKPQRLLHYLPTGAVILMIAFNSAMIIPAFNRISNLWFWYVIGIYVAANIFHRRRHRHADCYACRRLRFTGAAQAEIHKNRLSTFHWVARLRVIIAILAADISLQLLFPSTTWIVSATISLSFCYFLWLSLTHYKLIAWCPWCQNNGGGGGGEEAPVEPSPTPPGKRITI